MKALRPSLAAAALAALAATSHAQLQQVCHTDTIPFQITNWTGNVSIPKFDPTLGDLVSIDFSLQGDIRGTARVESLDNAPSTVNTQFAGSITLTRPDLSVIVVSLPVANFSDNLTAFDGTIDFGGTSGVTHANIMATNTVMTNSPPPASDLALFTGAGNIVLPVAAQGNSVATGSGNLITQFNTEAACSVQVCYNYRPNTPPVLQCPPTQMASVGVPLSFQICASDIDPQEIVTLNVTGLPPGATTNPPLPVMGNPACVTIDWTPDGTQVGTFTLTVVATDLHARSQTCTVDIVSAECHLLLGPGFGASQQQIFGHLYDTQLTSLRRFWPVTMADMPSFALNRLPPVIYLQVVMYNPIVFPQNPSQWSPTLKVIHNANGTLSTEYLGTANGIGIRPELFTLNGQQRVRFPFRIAGM